MGFHHALHHAVKVLGGDRMLGIDEPIVVELGEDVAVGIDDGGRLDHQGWWQLKAWRWAAVSHSWKTARMTQTFLASRRLPRMR